MNNSGSSQKREGVFHITPVSPIHIGSGEKYLPFEYSVAGRDIIIKDIQAFIEANRDNPQYAVDAIESGTVDVENKYPRYRVPCFGYSAPASKTSGPPQSRKPMNIAAGPRGKVDPNVAKLMKESEQRVKTPPPMPHSKEEAVRGTLIYAFIKDPFGKPFVPGTSLKGCLRTAIALHLYEKDKSLINGALAASKSKQWAFAPVAEKLFGKGPTNDPLKTFVLRDSDALNMEQHFAVTHVKVMNLVNNALKEKQGMTILTESLMPKVGKVSIPFFIDLFRLQKDTALPRAAKDLSADTQTFEAVFREFSQKLLDHEFEFYNKYRAQEGVVFIEKLRKDNAVYLDLGFGTGWEAKTIGLGFDTKTLNDVRRKWKLGKNGADIFPKTRKWVHNGQGYVPMGWFKLEIEWR